jgi:hypothetical protein
MKRRSLFGAAAAVTAAGPAAALAAPAPFEIPTAGELAVEVTALLGPVVNIGPASNGVRRLIPITGGSFKGPRIQGEVIPGGGDWQTTRADGCTVLEAIYALKTSDGAAITVRNLGLIAPRPDGKVYIRTVPSFDAPRGPHDWLNQSVFVGTLEVVDPGKAVRLRMFRVG